MGDKTGIEWTDATWNPIVGCSHCSPGCDHCYAATQAAGRLSGTSIYAGLAVRAEGQPAKFTGEVRLLPDRLDQPLRWKRPRRIFVNSMSDLFHPEVPVEFIAKVFAVMAEADEHTYQVLTKRPQRMALVVGSEDFHSKVVGEVAFLRRAEQGWANPNVPWPLPNVWLGASIESNDYAWRAKHLLPGWTPWVSAEPLIGRLDKLELTGPCPTCNGERVVPVPVFGGFRSCDQCGRPGASDYEPTGRVPLVEWVVGGGESGHGARPMAAWWIRELRDRCVEAGVPFLFKQWGEWVPHSTAKPASDRNTLAVHPAGMTALTPDNPFDPFERGHPGWAPMRRVGKKAAGRLLDGRTWDEYPGVVDAGL